MTEALCLESLDDGWWLPTSSNGNLAKAGKIFELLATPDARYNKLKKSEYQAG